MSQARGVGKVFAVALAVLATAGAAAPVMPHPGPNLRPADNASCETCHTAIAGEWRQSLHHASFSDADYQRAILREDGPFCRNCHAPERDANLGVACITCHQPGDARGTAPTILAAPGSAAAPHPVLRTAAFATEAACARCHEFDFPDTSVRRTPLAMQRTVTEHRGRSETCQDCHMKRRSGHVDHRFAAARDEAFVRSAVTVSARRVARSIEVTLAPAGVGHAFPTGDLFRRVRVSAGREERFLARHYATRQERSGVVVTVETSDDRVLGEPRVVVLPAPDASTHVRVAYERAEAASDTRRSNVAVDGTILLYEADL